MLLPAEFAYGIQKSMKHENMIGILPLSSLYLVLPKRSMLCEKKEIV
jgi:hypothetical protein